MVSFDASGQRRCANTATPRIDGRDEENARRLYITIERCEVKCTADPNVIDIGKQIFHDGGSIVKFLDSGEASVAYNREFSLPFAKSRSDGECREALLNHPSDFADATLRLMA